MRVYRLGAESIWLDEAFSIQFAHGSPSEIIEETAKDVHPPLYYFALHYWIELFGDTEFSSRLLSALFGVLAIPAIYKLAASIYDRSTGLLAATLLALSHFHIEFSQEARMYTLLTLLTLLSMHFFLKLLAGRRGALAFALYITSSALMLYTHVYSLFVLAAQNLFFLSLPFAAKNVFGRVWKRWLVAQGALFVLFLPWLSVLVQQFSRVQRGFWIPRQPPGTLLDTFILYAGSRQLALLLFPLVALSIFLEWRGRQDQGPVETSGPAGLEGALTGQLKIYFLLLWLVCPILLPFVASEFMSPIFLPKYTIPASAAFIILASRGFLSVRFHQLRMVLALLLICFSLVDLRDYYRAVKKDTWRDAVAEVEKLAQPGDLMLFNQQSGQSPFDYYLRKKVLDEKPFPDFSSELRADNVAELLKPAVEGHDRVWLVISHPGPLSPLIAEQLKTWYTAAAHINDPGVEIYLFEKR
ncbi:MAG TPA: glycosyltransferase family 39 protein [Pyrinomonadaceae bacterium]|nr:glycosyltransferase family 39 protein [Pyrinomonadaceae bacterium]